MPATSSAARTDAGIVGTAACEAAAGEVSPSNARASSSSWGTNGHSLTSSFRKRRPAIFSIEPAS